MAAGAAGSAAEGSEAAHFRLWWWPGHTSKGLPPVTCFHNWGPPQEGCKAHHHPNEPVDTLDSNYGTTHGQWLCAELVEQGPSPRGMHSQALQLGRQGTSVGPGELTSALWLSGRCTSACMCACVCTCVHIFSGVCVYTGGHAHVCMSRRRPEEISSCRSSAIN